MQKSVASYRAQAFLYEQKKSSIAFEVKAVRAIWDPSLSIPGTNRRGGWRCPTGTRYGGQITDRFGRQCGWGVARRIANAISDVGERVEGLDDRRRGRRLERRNARVGRRLAEGGLLERGARGIAEALEGRNDRSRSESTIPQVEAPKVPTPPARRVAPAPAPRRRGDAPVAQRRRRPNLRESEARRMQREIDQPGAPRTEEGAVPQRPAPRPRPAQQRRPRQRRQDAVEQRAQEAPKPAPKPRAVPRGQSDNAARSEQLRREREQINQPKVRVEPKPSGEGGWSTPKAPKTRTPKNAKDVIDIGRILGNENNQEYPDYIKDRVLVEQRLNLINDPANFPASNAEKENIRNIARIRINAATNRLGIIQAAIDRGAMSDDDYIQVGDERMKISRAKTLIRDHRDAWNEVIDGNRNKTKTPKPATVVPPKVVKPAKGAVRGKPYVAPKSPELVEAHINKLNDIVEGINDPIHKAVLINEMDALKADALQAVYERENQLQDILIDVSERVRQLGRPPTDDEIKTLLGNAFRNQGLPNPYDTDPNGRYNLNRQLNRAQQNLAIALQRVEGARVDDVRKSAFADYVQQNAEYVRVKQVADRFKDMEDAIANSVDKPPFDGGGTTAAGLQRNAANLIKEEIDKGVKARRNKVAKYLETRYGKNGDLPWKDMTPAKWSQMSVDAKNQYLVKLYGHDKIVGDNGKIYMIEARASGGNYVNAEFFEINENGVKIRKVGRSSREILNGYVYNATLFISGNADKNNGLATYYNQHAFMGLQAIGINKAKVTAASDGRFVWAKVGYKPGSKPPARPFKKALNFYEKFGSGGIIANDEQYNLVKGLVAQMELPNSKITHQDLIYAMQVGKRDKSRDNQIKGWFLANAAIDGGMLSFASEGIVADPRKLQPPANTRKRAARPRAPRNAPQQAPNRVA